MRRRLRVERLAHVGQEIRGRGRVRGVGGGALEDVGLPDLFIAEHADEDLAPTHSDLIRDL